MLIGYARVSTRDQKPHLHMDALGEAGCERGGERVCPDGGREQDEGGQCGGEAQGEGGHGGCKETIAGRGLPKRACGFKHPLCCGATAKISSPGAGLRGEAFFGCGFSVYLQGFPYCDLRRLFY